MISPDVWIFSDPEAEQDNVAISSLIEFLGLTSRVAGTLEALPGDKIECMAFDAEYLARLEPRLLKRVFRFAERHVASALVYRLRPDGPGRDVVRTLSNGGLQGVQPATGEHELYSVSTDNTVLTAQFSGLTFGPIDRSNDLALVLGPSRVPVRAAVVVGNAPLFASTQLGKCELFWLATREVTDVNAWTRVNVNARNFSGLIPPMMFLRYIFKDRCWQASGTFANVTIDDPLVRRRYGLLDFEVLARSLREHDFAATVSFIPWNYKKSAQTGIRIFRENADRLGLCVHGCDHTECEFAATDSIALGQKLRLATARMVAHQESTGLPFDRVMVFPRGAFSAESMLALKKQNYLGAVNSGVSFQGKEAAKCRLHERMDMAVLRYEGFPLFMRRSAGDVVEFALDAFLQKPVLVDSHHDSFRTGMNKITPLVDRINSLEGRPQWCTLGETLRHGYKLKLERDGDVSCRVYANDIRLTNPYPQTKRFRILKSESEEPALSLLAGDHVALHERRGNDISLALELEPGESISLRAVYEKGGETDAYHYRMGERIAVHLRRTLSELRDNYISRSETLLSLARCIKSRIVGDQGLDM